MTTELIIAGGFVLTVAIISRLIPGKTDKNLVFDHDERLLYECQNLHIRRYSRLGRGISRPGSKIQITNKRIVFSQKGFLSARYVIHEIAVRKSNPPESLKNTRFWGLVFVFEYGKNDFSFATKDGKIVITFRNCSAPNMDRMEIVGVTSVDEFMQAID